MKTIISSTGVLAMLTVLASVAVGCNDTADALDERANQEHAELRADVEQLKSDLRAAEVKMEEQAAELERRAQEASRDTKDAARDAAERGSQAIQHMGHTIEKRVDEADKAIANQIRDDG